MATIDLTITVVPPTYQYMVDRLRKYLNDEALKNTLTGIQESTDLELFMALQDS